MNLRFITENTHYWRSDILSGLVVFLIALPLSLGISFASGAPASAGLISAVLGGLFGSFLGGSSLAINGPAAGLIVVVLSGIQNLGHGDQMLGFRRVLACLVIVGALQIISGFIKAGKLVALFPLSVVHGMLTSIGLIIMIKQLHVFFGHSAGPSIVDSVLGLPESVLNLVPESALIGLFGISVLLVYPHLKFRPTKSLPAPLIVAAGGILLGLILHPKGLVNIPTSPNKFLITPVFDVISSTQSILVIVTIFFVASLESILSASAIDQLDPLGRESDFNKELWSKGVINLLCGLIGGLPVIAEIVRSSANISHGGRTPLANFSHGIFILMFILLFPSVLNMIPLSALAAILIYVGLRLANPKQFKEMLGLGLNSFIAFAITIVVTLLEDLLLGILAGMIVEGVFSFMSHSSSFSRLLNPKFDIKVTEDNAIIHLEGSISFLSTLKQKELFLAISNYKVIEMDLTKVSFIDPTSLFLLSRETAKIKKNGGIVRIRLPEKYHSVFQRIEHHS